MNENPNELIRFIEGLAANAWRPVIEQQLDGWRIRVTGGSSSRVNSVWPNQLSGQLGLEERISLVEDFYRRHNQPACFQMCPAAQPDHLSVELASRGYEEIKHTMVQTAPVEVVIENTLAPSAKIVQTPNLNEDWFQTYTCASDYSPESLPIRRGILSRIGPAANFLLLIQHGEPIAVGLGVTERSWMGVFCVVTYAGFRRQNFASQVMHRLTSWGIKAGAKQLYLQVMNNNPPALALYQKLGFTTMYDYWYSQKEIN